MVNIVILAMLALVRFSHCVHTQLGSVMGVLPVGLGRDLGGWLQADLRVPLPRGEYCHLVQELVYPSHQVTTVTSLVGNFVENLENSQKQNVQYE